MAAVILYATLAGYLMHLVIDSHPRLFQFLSELNMSMATLITPLFLLRWGWRHWRPPPARGADPVPPRRPAGSRPTLQPDVCGAAEWLPDAGAGLLPVLALPGRQPHR
ncbi:hypothetical protein [Aeromonas sanarellii]|uniref:hypothetical protein n=1 Tax=Aeromonas sanarellii TaxID=633415 RepID=UPI0038CFA2A8